MKHQGKRLLVSQALIIILLATLRPISTLAINPSEMLPIWQHESHEMFSNIAISADGKYIAAGTSDTGLLYLFSGQHLLWTCHVGEVNSLAMSRDGKYITVGAADAFYLFDRENSEPQFEYQVNYGNSLVAISSNGSRISLGTMPSDYQTGCESQLYMFENGQHSPIWVATLQGVLESLSMSETGNHIIATTSMPGRLHAYAYDQNVPQWIYDFGAWSGGAKISADSSYVVAVGGDKEASANFSHWPRVFQFSMSDGSFTYQKAVPELPPYERLAVSQNGSIFILSYNSEHALMLFDMNIRPYGPSSLHTLPVLTQAYELSISSSGRYTILCTENGLSVFKYSNNSYNLWKQYTAYNTPIYAVSHSEIGYTAALGCQKTLNHKQTYIYLFDIFQENHTDNPLTRWELWIAITFIIVLGSAAIVLVNKRKTLATIKFKKQETAVE